ncbi:hypothetical protein C8A05DRAFT_31467 [Staphylotrichum tortipilum]|uniref:Chromo domain-containing protein n=1 Tax=Staphylotrichum tortipilum TaxID=2831512 RepID=A0AAN6MQT0_9PEZI|nr:hypothetical protein C8A05DRAFT_31467 [Staphylotrichum longicolle]
MSPTLIQSDLLNSLKYDSPVEDAGEDAGLDAGPTVVTLDDRAATSASGPGTPEADMEGWAAGDDLNSPAAAPPSTLKKRGRASLTASATPAGSVTSKTPRSTKSTGASKSAGRSTGKRKAAEPEPEEDETDVDKPEEDEALKATPVTKRGGRAARSAGAAASARLAAKAAKKPAKKAGRPKKQTNGDVPAGEYEVEAIVESAIDADTMEHMYLIKWRNYPTRDNTWEPKRHLKGSLNLVREFDAQKKKAEAAEAAKKAATARKTAAAATSGEKKPARGPKRKAAKAVKATKPAKKGPGRPRRTGRTRG